MPQGMVGSGLATQWMASPNFDERRPNYVVIHQTTSDSAEKALRTLTDSQRKVSAHYLIGRNGVVYQLVDERVRAWHAGESWWGGLSDLNSASIGIELDNNGEEPFSDTQVFALLGLLGDLRLRYLIPPENFIGHADIAPRRKVDPSRYFPWKTLAEHGFGLWCEKPELVSQSDADTSVSLLALGYDVLDPVAAVRAFRRHFLGEESSVPLGDSERNLLRCLLQKKTERQPVGK